PAHAALPRRYRHHQHLPGLRGGLRDDAGWATVRDHDRGLSHLPGGVPALQPRRRFGSGHRAVHHHCCAGSDTVPAAGPERRVLMASLRFDPFMRDMAHPVRPTRLGATVILLILIVLSLAALVPLYWMFATSLTPSAMTVKLPPELIPSEPTLDNYRTVLRQPNFGRWVLNSLIQALSVQAVT